MPQPTLDRRSPDGRQASALLAEAARAIHAEPDSLRLQQWATDAARILAGAETARLFLVGSFDFPEWTISTVEGVAHPDGLAAVGDPRRHPALLRALQDQDTLRIDDLQGAGWDGELRQSVPSLSSLLAVPVSAAQGAAHGLLLLGHAEPDWFSGDEEAFVVALAAHLGVALDNLANRAALEQLRATEREIVNQLQAAVMPSRPDVAFTELGTYYSPADPGAHTGGDLHDWVVLPDGDLHVAVVDVMGKGVAATKDALAVTHTVRLLLFDGCPLDQLVARADTIVSAQNPELVATLLIGRYRPATGMLQLAGGGHPPALLVTGDGVRRLSAPGIPIGWPGAGSEGVVEVCLDRSDTVILYTDGLVEGTGDIVKGLEALERFARETALYPAEQQARILVERTLRGAGRRDDSLALTLRRRSPPTEASVGALGPFEHRLSRSTAAVSVSRRLLADWLTRVPVDDEAADDLLLVATELCANAVSHATWSGDGVVVRARVESPDVVLEVEDDGNGISWPYFDPEPPDPESEHGRGLWLVRTFTDEAVPETVDGRTVVRCVKRAVVSAR